MDSVMDFANISFIYHAIQNGQLSHYPMINDLKRKNVRDVRHKKRKKLIRTYTEKCVSVLYLGPCYKMRFSRACTIYSFIRYLLGLLNFNVFPHLIQECEKLGDYVVNVVEARMGVRQHEA